MFSEIKPIHVFRIKPILAVIRLTALLFLYYTFEHIVRVYVHSLPYKGVMGLMISSELLSPSIEKYIFVIYVHSGMFFYRCCHAGLLVTDTLCATQGASTGELKVDSLELHLCIHFPPHIIRRQYFEV